MRNYPFTPSSGCVMLAPSRIGSFDPDPDPFFVGRGLGVVNINKQALKCVAFVGVKKDGTFQPRATAFFLRYVEDQHGFDHLVTAEHVISGLLTKNEEIWLRLNLKDGSSKEIRLDDAAAFRYHPDNERNPTDVAVCPFSAQFQDDETGDTIDADIISLRLDGEQGFAPSQDFVENTIQLGAEIAIIGLFRSHYGRNQNVPVVRVGNIAALPGEPVFTKYAGYVQAYLIEARSIAGLSGSPVLAFPDPAILLAKGLTGDFGQGAALLGLMHGHFDVPHLNEDVVADEEEPKRGVHTGIGVVIPFQKIIETIKHPELVEMRKAIVARLRKESGATADAADDGGDKAPPSTDVNPNHREDFMRLANAAARRREQED